MSKTELSHFVVANIIAQGEKRFLESMKLLEPRDYCDVYLKALKLLMPTEVTANINQQGNNIVNIVNQLSIKMLTE